MHFAASSTSFLLFIWGLGISGASGLNFEHSIQRHSWKYGHFILHLMRDIFERIFNSSSMSNLGLEKYT